MSEQMEQSEREKYIRGFGAMVLSRTLDNKIMSAQRQGRVGFFTPTMGQEAAQIGLSMNLKKEDTIYQYYRDMPMMIHMGVPVDIIINQIYGNSADIALGRQMPSHLLARDYNFMSVPSPVATNLPLAVGTAYANRYLGKPGLVVASFGDGSSSTPDFHAALNLAAVFSLPVIFFCENNGLAISLPTEKQTKTEIWKKAEAYGMPGILVEGSNLVDSYNKTKDIVDYVRSGKGPALIEARCPRMGPHSTSDDPSKYATDIVKENSERDPMVITRNHLIEMGVISDHVVEKMMEDSRNFVTAKFDELEKIPPPSPEKMFDDVYESMTWIIKEEKGDIIGRN
ncbi:MAG: thiamine pyrophosphate-dependent dehydrogenase E1 component subunit alpha [Candidatus Thermoplasmatota archaeon]|nr:thiamine pyrophosphate-dependent dehydrogenase E1 component subunit alpha [Candidatus Thermoplasmatota archaeon]